jgi:Spy/CpxP family protein refolding chaperone
MLTPEQQTKFDKLIAERKTRWPKLTYSPPA